MEQGNAPKTSKVDLFLKIFLCLDLVAILCLGIAIFVAKTNLTGELVYEYQDDSIPGGEYKVSLDYSSGYVQIIETRFCSTVDCPSSTVEHTGNLDTEELKKVKTLTSKDYDARSLTSALESLIEGGIFKAKSEIENEEYWSELFADLDLDGDGVITNKEFGNKQLDYLIKER